MRKGGRVGGEWGSICGAKNECLICGRVVGLEAGPTAQAAVSSVEACLSARPAGHVHAHARAVGPGHNRGPGRARRLVRGVCCGGSRCSTARGGTWRPSAPYSRWPDATRATRARRTHAAHATRARRTRTPRTHATRHARTPRVQDSAAAAAAQDQHTARWSSSPGTLHPQHATRAQPPPTVPHTPQPATAPSSLSSLGTLDAREAASTRRATHRTQPSAQCHNRRQGPNRCARCLPA
jgi:hypothetical protein